MHLCFNLYVREKDHLAVEDPEPMVLFGTAGLTGRGGALSGRLDELQHILPVVIIVAVHVRERRRGLGNATQVPIHRDVLASAIREVWKH